MMSTTFTTDTTVPLTATQKMWLASRFLPVIVFVLAVVFSATILPNMMGRALPVWLPIFLIVVLLVMIYEASKSLRDLLSGVAVIEEDDLERVWHTRKGGNSKRYAKFTRLGRMQLSRQAYGQANTGQRVRVCYSPASRIVWSIE